MLLPCALLLAATSFVPTITPTRRSIGARMDGGSFQDNRPQRPADAASSKYGQDPREGAVVPEAKAENIWAGAIEMNRGAAGIAAAAILSGAAG